MPVRSRPSRPAAKRTRSDILIARIALALVERLERGESVAAICRELGLPADTVRALHSEDAADATAARLRDENRRLRRRLRALAADKAILQQILRREP